MRHIHQLGYSEEFLTGLKKDDRIYMRIHNPRKEVTFHRTYQDGRKRGGTVYRFNGNERGKIYKRIQNAWKGFSKHELEQWRAPEWLVNWFLNSRKNIVHATMINNMFIIKFKTIPTPFVIPKSNVFFQMYDKQRYLYDTILDIANYSGIDNVHIITDMADILRINRLSYGRNDIKILVKLRRGFYLKKEMMEMLGWTDNTEKEAEKVE